MLEDDHDYVTKALRRNRETSGGRRETSRGLEWIMNFLKRGGEGLNGSRGQQ
jgi:hypothetical protein